MHWLSGTPATAAREGHDIRSLILEQLLAESSGWSDFHNIKHFQPCFNRILLLTDISKNYSTEMNDKNMINDC
jgi:hypothetical protein